jgi:hypothetical protein
MMLLRVMLTLLAVGVVVSSEAHAQFPVVNCAMFRNPQDRANCDAQNRAARNNYLRERAYEYGHRGADALNKLAPYVAGRRVPGGAEAYQGGNALGTEMYNGYDGQPPEALQPGFQPYYPYPFGPPQDFTYRRPPPPRYVPPPGY